MNARERQPACDEEPTESTLTYEIGEGESVTEAVVTAVSSVADESETELQPLYTVIDPDALDALFGPRWDGTPSAREGKVAFEYGKYEVQVRRDGRIVVC